MTKWLTCPHCQGLVELEGSRGVGLAEAIAQKLREARRELRASAIVAMFPGYTEQSIKNAINELRRLGRIESERYGYWKLSPGANPERLEDAS